MKILFITPCIPTETDGRRPFNFIKYLSKRHDVHLLAMKLPVQSQDNLQPLLDMGITAQTLAVNPYQSILKCLFGMMLKKPLRVLWCSSSRMRNAIRRIQSEKTFDIVHIDRMRMGQYAEMFQQPTVVDFTDSLVMYLQRSVKFRKSWREKWIDRWELATIPRFERRILQNVRASLVCSTIDAEVYKEWHGDIRMKVIENAVDYHQFKPKHHTEPHQMRGIITGTLFYFPNIDSVQYYKESILPWIRQKLPHFETIVAGTRPTAYVSSLHGLEGVQIKANVPQMSDLLYQDDVYLCPLRVAAGIRNKLLEAMSAGMPIITTPLGAEGLNVQHEKEMLFADTPQDFVTQLERLIHSPELRQHLGNEARQYVINHHGLESLGAKLEGLYQELVENMKG